MSSALVQNTWSAEQCARVLAKAKRSPTGWKACCPAHEDKDPSLFLADGEDGIALVCYAGCDYKAIAQALEAKGAVLSGSARDGKSIPTEHYELGGYHSHWDYRDAAGRVVLRVCRWEQPGNKKDIRPLTRTADGGWKWGHHPNPRPLFQLDRLTNEPTLPVLLVEGEKTAAAAQKLFPDHITTTWPGGAAAMGQADLSPLAGRDVILIPDCDGPGRKAMSWMHNHLKGSSRNVRLIDPANIVKGLPEGWDLADALHEKRDVSNWLAQAEELPQGPHIILRSALELAETPVRVWWLLEPYLERNASILVFGDLGTLKSFLALHWALEVALTGEPVVYLSAEGKGLGKRVKGWAVHRWGEGWQRELGRVPFFGIERPLNLSSPLTIADLIATMDTGVIEPALVVVDTMSKNSDGSVEASNEDAQRYLNQLDRELRARFEATVLLVHHCGHLEKGRARGPYSLMANTDSNFLIERPDIDKLTITVTAGRMKDTESPVPFSLVGRVVDTGGVDHVGRPITTLILEPTSEVVIHQPKRPTGSAQKAILSALEARQRDAAGVPVWTIDEIRKLAVKELGETRTTARDAIAKLVEIGFLKQTIGGLCLAYQS